jgi:hypothetical protein
MFRQSSRRCVSRCWNVIASTPFLIRVTDMINKLQRNLLVSLCAPFVLANAHGATINASSCALSAVQSAINAATNGDTVSVPTGTCTWSSQLSLPDTKKLTLQGAGIDKTTVTGSVHFNKSGSRVTGFTFNGNQTMRSEGHGFRFDHNKVIFSRWGEGFYIAHLSGQPPVAPPHGLIDNNHFVNGRVVSSGSQYMLSEGDQQHSLWTTELDLGGATSVYIEDNTFTMTDNGQSRNVIDGNYGGRYVFRYNTVVGMWYAEAHSPQEQGNRGMRSWEIYGNTFNNNSNMNYYPYRIRGGTGLIFSNSITGNWTNNGIAFDNVRSYASSGLGGGMCNGSSGWDGNSNQYGYPCRDQIGRSKDSPRWSHNPPGKYTQSLVPAYVWLNRTGSNAELTVDVINEVPPKFSLPRVT